MEYRTLGTTGVKVSKFCLGAMMFGSWGNTDHDDCIRITHAALDGGINFIDTADVYGEGESEEILAKALKGGRRDDVILATKCHLAMSDEPNHQGSSRRWIYKAVEDSLRRLDTDYIDLFQIHRLQSDCDHDETLGALTDLVRAGKIRYIGSSTYPPSAIVEAQWTAERRNRERFVCEQPPYSLLYRAIEIDHLPTIQRHRMGAIAWGPLGGGWLSGRWRKGTTTMESSRQNRLPRRYDLSLPDNQRKLDVTEDLALLAEENDLSLIHLGLAFVVNHPGITSAIIGPRTMEHLESQIGAAEVKLSTETLDRIDKIVPPGTNVAATDAGYAPPSLLDKRLRRRS
jgi:aryl-alcohol dehydrogenase-like predicted oxidoreductase